MQSTCRLNASEQARHPVPCQCATTRKLFGRLHQPICTYSSSALGRGILTWITCSTTVSTTSSTTWRVVLASDHRFSRGIHAMKRLWPQIIPGHTLREPSAGATKRYSAQYQQCTEVTRLRTATLQAWSMALRSQPVPRPLQALHCTKTTYPAYLSSCLTTP